LGKKGRGGKREKKFFHPFWGMGGKKGGGKRPLLHALRGRVRKEKRFAYFPSM